MIRSLAGGLAGSGLANSATPSTFDLSMNDGPVNVGCPPPITFLLFKYSHSESTAK